KGGKAAPDRQRPYNHKAAPGPVRQQCERHAEERVKQRKSETADCTELRIAEVQVVFDRTGQNAKHLPVEEIENVGSQQEAEDDIAVTCRRGRLPFNHHRPSSAYAQPQGTVRRKCVMASTAIGSSSIGA